MDRSRILALDYGRVHTGVAVSDPSGTVVRPLDPIDDAASAAGLKRIASQVEEERVGLIMVGMPVSLSGEVGPQAKETADFVAALRDFLDVPVKTWDERFTSKIADIKGRFSKSSPHSLAACCLLEDYIGSDDFKRRAGGR